MTQYQKNLAFNAEVRRIMNESDLPYDAAFQVAMATRADLADGMTRPATLSNDSMTPSMSTAGIAFQTAVQKLLQDMNWTKDAYQTAWNIVAKQRPELLAAMQKPFPERSFPTIERAIRQTHSAEQESAVRSA